MRRALVLLALCCAAVASAALPAGAGAATGPGSAVVLVSGFDTVTPFSTPDPACAGQEGPAWNPAGGVAETLKGAGFNVFTAPVNQAGNPPPAPCAPGTPAPDVNTSYINSNGDVTANGQALGNFIAFLRDNYGVTHVDLVAHSDGGLWSRSAITQEGNYPGVTITSLTTLGTPHTGSFIADISQDFSNGQCKAKNQLLQLVCVALQRVVSDVINDLGLLTVSELTSDFLATWNPEQRIGACPVTGIAGTFFDFPIPPSLLSAYYNPSDGLVGEASAHAQAAKSIYGTPIPAAGIPNFINGGSFPVVHGSSFAFLSNATLLNQQAISNTVLAALQSQTGSEPACAAPEPQPQPPPSPTDGNAKVTTALHRYVAPFRGRLPKPREGDQVLHRDSVKIKCRNKVLEAAPFFGDTQLLVTLPHCNRRLEVKGKGEALLIRTRGTATIEIQGTSVTADIGGVPVRRVRLELEQDGKFDRVPLNDKGEGTLPAGSGPTTLRVKVLTRRGGRLVGSATVSR